MTPNTIEPIRPLASLVILEVGTRMVSATLCDVVAGRHRLFATAEAWLVSPDAGPLDAVGRALRSLEASSGRRLMSEHGIVTPTSQDGVGCDSIVVSGGKPLRASIVSFGKVAASVLDGVDPLLVEFDALPSVEDAVEDRLGLAGEIVTALRENRPDVLVVVGGADFGSFDSAAAFGRILTAAHASCPGGLPLVLLVATAAVRERFNARLLQHGYRATIPLPTFRQSEPDGLPGELRSIWQEAHASLPLWQALAGGTANRPAPRLESVGRACQALSRARDAPVWAIEVGDSDVVVLRATSDRFDSARRPISQLNLDGETNGVAEWLRRPWLAVDDRAAIDHQRVCTVRAIAEVASRLHSLGRSEPLPGLIVGRGVGLVHRLPSTDAALALCLGIGLTGPTTVALDRHGLLAGAGVLLDSHADVGADLIRDSLDILGVVVVGRTDDSDNARVQVEDGPEGTRAPSDVRPDEFIVLSSEGWANAEITLIPSRSVDVGYGDGHRGQVSMGDGEIGGMLTITRGHAPRRWARVQGTPVGLAGLLRRSS